MKHIYRKGSNELTFVLLHGTGGDEYSLIELAQYLDPSANVLAVRGNENERGANRFFKRKAEGVYDVENLYENGTKLAEFIKKASEENNFDLDKTIMIGFSNGSNIAINVLLEHSDLINKAMLFAPLYPLDSDTKELKDTNIFISSGKNDPIVSIEDSHHVVEIFESRGAKVKQTWVNSHEVTPDALNKAKEWLDEVLNK